MTNATDLCHISPPYIQGHMTQGRFRLCDHMVRRLRSDHTFPYKLSRKILDDILKYISMELEKYFFI